MKRLTKYIKSLFAICFVSNRTELTVWCSDFDFSKKLWEEVYLPDGWDIKEPIQTKWNWKRFNYEYRFKLTKK